MTHYCRANQIDLTGESDAGRGPVDFKFIQDWSARALVEIKLASNSRFWHGLSKQTVQYLTSEEINTGYFVYVINHAKYDTVEFRDQAKKLAAEASEKAGVKIRVIEIDARPKLSASKLTGDGSSTIEAQHDDVPPEDPEDDDSPE